MSQQLLGSFVMSTLGKDSKEDAKQEQIPINFYVHRLTTELKKTFGFCLIF